MRRRRPRTGPRSSPPRARSSPSSATAARACATSCAARTSPAARSTTTSPTRSRCFAPSSTRAPSRSAHARRTRAAEAGSLEEFVAAGYREYFGFLASDPEAFELMRRNSGTIRAMFDEPIFGAGIDELAADLRGAIDAGIVPALDVEYMASAMVGAALEVGVAMVRREPPDVEGATRFATGLVLGGIERLGRRASRGRRRRRPRLRSVPPSFCRHNRFVENCPICRQPPPSPSRRPAASSSPRTSRSSTSSRVLARVAQRGPRAQDVAGRRRRLPQRARRRRQGLRGRRTPRRRARVRGRAARRAGRRPAGSVRADRRRVRS